MATKRPRCRCRAHVPLAVTFGLIGDRFAPTSAASAAAEAAKNAKSSSSSSSSSPFLGATGHVDHGAERALDPSGRVGIDGRVTSTLNAHGEVCAVHKLGGAPLVPEQLLALANAAADRAAELHEG